MDISARKHQCSPLEWAHSGGRPAHLSASLQRDITSSPKNTCSSRTSEHPPQFTALAKPELQTSDSSDENAAGREQLVARRWFDRANMNPQAKFQSSEGIQHLGLFGVT